ncbi:hypothetical protein ASG11_04210 [Sphingomonas sp. Leaf357]|uniref:hypothetical protein n=1 Tax=Sphingomonas sp. Leaf357 TaxID=1736350 RepID=UPI0006FD50FA|nr:hypothetical protein [Sphingomonas sp. Leaf357]KQS03555.1 hypothetical protein ASG11_04210 [Sphingomonas sp. Leaf357]
MTLVLLDNDNTQVVRRVPQGEARREATLRDMIADHPSMLPVHDLDPSYGRLITVTKELSIPGVGFVDILLMDEHGRLVVVECKLWRNPQARREVVGQILDYAREISRFGYEDLQRQVSIATRRPGNVLHTLAREAGGTLSEADFVDRVTRDLTAGRFLLLVVGDGIAEGTRRIGEYLRDQPGLAFNFGLIEMAEYRLPGTNGAHQIIMQPRVLAQTAVIERHVIRSEVPGIAIDPVVTLPNAPSTATSATSQPTDAGIRWRAFVDRFLAETTFDDPGQPPARSGGTGWMRVPLPDGFYVNVYRSSGQNRIGAEVRFPGTEGAVAFSALGEERRAIDAEFSAQNIGGLEWIAGDVPALRVTAPYGPPGDEASEVAQRQWMGRAANQFVNSLRPRLQRLGQDLAA